MIMKEKYAKRLSVSAPLTGKKRASPRHKASEALGFRGWLAGWGTRHRLAPANSRPSSTAEPLS